MNQQVEGMNRRLSHFVLLPPDDNFLIGSLPTELGALTKLQRLHMCKCNEQAEVMNRRISYFVLLPPVENSLTGSLPTELGALSELEYLRMCKSNEQVEVIKSQSFSFCAPSTSF
jgi:hypothetical protein